MGNSESVATLGLGLGPGLSQGSQGLGQGLSQGSQGLGPGLSQGSHQGLGPGVGSLTTQGSSQSHGRMIAGTANHHPLPAPLLTPRTPVLIYCIIERFI